MSRPDAPDSGPDSRESLEAIETPVLLMQGNPRQVVTANQRARDLFRKELHEVEGRRGGQVFDCVHSFTDAGCGKDVNCEDCKIRKAEGTMTYVLQVSTEKAGDLALVRIERYEDEA